MRYPPDFVLICSAIFGTLMAGSAFGLASVAWGIMAALAWGALDRRDRGPPARWWQR